MKNKSKKFAQNSIDYIVYNNPEGVRSLIVKNEMLPPKNIHDLVKSTKSLVRKTGRPGIKALLRLHPDRRAILKIEKSKEDSYCPSCNNYNYNTDGKYCSGCGYSSYTGDGNNEELRKKLSSMSLEELEGYYDSIVKDSNQEPENSGLSEQVRIVWNELRQRKASPGSKEAINGMVITPGDALITLSLTFFAGCLMGSAWIANNKVS